MIPLEVANNAAEQWRPFFCVIPRKVDGRWCFLAHIERRWKLVKLTEMHYRYVEEYRCSPLRS